MYSGAQEGLPAAAPLMTPVVLTIENIKIYALPTH